MDLPSVGFVIPTWRRGEMFRDSVKSLLNQTYKGHIEIMCVVDHDDAKPPEPQTYCSDCGAWEGNGWIHSSWTGYKVNPKHCGDVGIACQLRGLAETGLFNGPRSIRIKRGPGRSNWRPGAIHFPVFEYWLSSKCELVGYQFSDDLSPLDRVENQVRGMHELNSNWSYARRTEFIDATGKVIRGAEHGPFHPKDLQPSRSPCLPVYSFLLRRQNFIDVGGCDYPIHAGAAAESWIIANACLTGIPVVTNFAMQFRVHDDALGAKQGPESDTYKRAVAETGFTEKDHWDLWARIEPIYNERVRLARDGKGWRY